MDRRVLVIGATQGTGNLIADLLVREKYQVRALVRNEAKAKDRLSSAVEIVLGNVTKPETLRSAINAVDHIIFTAGVTKRPAEFLPAALTLSIERLVEATEYKGVKNTLAAASEAGFRGRFLYMTSIGITQPSFSATLLNLFKGNTLRWRKLAEAELRRSGVDYTIIRAGFLTNSPGGRRAIEVGQSDFPLAWRYRISRADVAEVFFQALRHPNTRRTTFEVVWAAGGQRKDWSDLFGRLKPD